MKGLFKLKSVVALCVLAALTACHPSVDSMSASFASSDAVAPQPALREQIAQLEKSGQIPSLDRTNTLLGIDANNNGVRDDIEAYINSVEARS